VRYELVCRSLKVKSLASHVRLLVNDIDDLREAWDTLNTCFNRPDKNISEALDPVIKFRSYKAFDSGAIREFYSLLRAAMMGARKAGLLGWLINDQMLPGILARMPPTDWRQWARERPNWMREATEEAFWNFVDQKWRDALNVAAAEPPAWEAGAGGKIAFQDVGRKEAAKPAKAGAAAVHVTGANGGRPRQGNGSRACVFKDVMECTGAHPPLALQGIWEAASKGKRKTDNGQQALPILPPPRQRQVMRGQAEDGVSSLHGLVVQGKACPKVARLPQRCVSGRESSPHSAWR
jgi:hypothetical protein